jgi:hypothetical protein
VLLVLLPACAPQVALLLMTSCPLLAFQPELAQAQPLAVPLGGPQALQQAQSPRQQVWMRVLVLVLLAVVATAPVPQQKALQEHPTQPRWLDSPEARPPSHCPLQTQQLKLPMHLW